MDGRNTFWLCLTWLVDLNCLAGACALKNSLCYETMRVPANSFLGDREDKKPVGLYQQISGPRLQIRCILDATAFSWEQMTKT